MGRNTQTEDRDIAVYTAYLNKLKELGDKAAYVSKTYVIEQIIDEFFIGTDHGLRIVNRMIKRDLNLETLNKNGAKRSTIRAILNKHFD